ncbi:TPA: hypothetical protein N0F65_000517 [Lagenidium giganteum]|uniref:Uncharacterized protein n=1 Tax=Lagenidium giganteum TaxID=4803 RepID=A0AAV2YCZ1_9STRA|nr:TPA: hypothetical protein N0F65_000517 [Lagenidium giganteum]
MELPGTSGLTRRKKTGRSTSGSASASASAGAATPAPTHGLKVTVGSSSSARMEEVDDRITIPLAEHKKQQQEHVLKTGISKYRSLSGKSTLLATTSASATATIDSSSSTTTVSSVVDRRHSSSGNGAAVSTAEHAQRLLDQKQYAAAIPFLTESLKHTSGTQQNSQVKLYYQRGSCYLAAQKYKQAAQDFTSAIDRVPRNGMLLAKRAKAYAQLNQTHAALADYNEAIELTVSGGYTLAGGSSTSAFGLPCLASSGSGGNVHNKTELRALYLARAKVYRQMNNYSSALADLARAETETDGHRDADMYYQRAQLYLQYHHHPLALKDFDRFIELQEGAVAVTGSAAGGDGSSRLIEVLLERAKLLMQLAVNEEEQHGGDAALQSVEQGGPAAKGTATTAATTATTPRAFVSASARALVERAVRDYTQVVMLDDGHVEAWRLRGEAHGKLDETNAAHWDFDKALALEPNDFQVHMSRAKLYQQQQEFQRAVEEVTAVLQVNGFFVDALFFRAQLFEQLGDHRRAQADYTSIIDAHLDLRGLNDAPSDSLDVSATSNSSSNQKTSKHGGTGSTNRSSNSGQVKAKGGKVTSEYAAQALLYRARLSLSMDLFDDAMEDYDRIIESFANHLEAQLELQDAKAKKIEYEQRKQQEALAWVERREEEEEDQEASGRISSSTKSKKKKKKKKKKTKAMSSGDNDAVDAVQSENERNKNDDDDDEASNATSPTKLAVTIVIEPDTKYSDMTISSPGFNYVTRDEACESLEPEDDEEVTQNIVASPTPAEDTSKRRRRGDETEMTSLTKSSGDGDDGGDDDNDEQQKTSAGDTAQSSAPASSMREVLVDERYLKKRRKQLENLRVDLLQACDERNREMLNEVIERAERKQMTDQLTEEIEQAMRVMAELERIANGGAPATESVPEEAQQPNKSDAIQDAPVIEPTKAPEVMVKEIVDEASATPVESSDKPDEAVTSPVQSQSTDSTVPEVQAAKPRPSLVIRPIDYGHALQQAEQHEHALQRAQQQLQERESEIAYLKQVIEQAKSVDLTEVYDQIELGPELLALRSAFPPALHALGQRIDQLVDWMGPSPEADQVRLKILGFVRRVLESHLPPASPILVFATGSFPMKTYLPTADLDVCLLFPKEMEPSWFFPVLNALALAASQSSGADGSSANGSPTPKHGQNSASQTNTVRNVSFINAEVRVIKCTVDNVSVDLTANRTGALGALVLLDTMDARVGKRHLLKKSLILVKAWCSHESGLYAASGGNNATPPIGSDPTSVLGASQGAFSTYALNTMVMALFNQYGNAITHPLQALYLFLDMMAEFPWHESAVTLFGPMPIAVLTTTPVLANGTVHKKKRKTTTAHQNFCALLKPDDVERIRARLRDQFTAFETHGAGFLTVFPTRVCNVVDPLHDGNNLARSVSVESFPRMKRAFRLGRNRLGALLTSVMHPSKSVEDTATVATTELDAYFALCWRLYGRGDGWRPDLLIHPRQTWHGKPASSVVGTSDEAIEEARWQSLLPELLLSPVPMPGPGPGPVPAVAVGGPTPVPHSFTHGHGGHGHSKRPMSSPIRSTSAPMVGNTTTTLPPGPMTPPAYHGVHYHRRGYDKSPPPSGKAGAVVIGASNGGGGGGVYYAKHTRRSDPSQSSANNVSPKQV